MVIQILVLETLIEWGGNLAREAYPPPLDYSDPKIGRIVIRPAGDFLSNLSTPREHVPPMAVESRWKGMTIEDIKSEAKKWAEELTLLPYEEAIEAYTLAVDDWRQTDYISYLLQEGFDHQKALEASKLLHRWWWTELGWI